MIRHRKTKSKDPQEHQEYKSVQTQMHYQGISWDAIPAVQNLDFMYTVRF